ncbi:MAG: hypothetical protein OJJ54_00550 [Pseudonocardia sp.]|nr:hypothetical protein [Pseudonocardia sp.]
MDESYAGPRDDAADAADGAFGPEGVVDADGVVRRVDPGVRDVARAKVLLRYARLLPAGRPVFCKPSRAELEGMAPRRQGRGADGKVIYSDREAAEAAARELEDLGARPQRAYVCKRSRHGHFHLTTDLVAERHRAFLESRIPRQQGVASRDLSAAVPAQRIVPGARAVTPASIPQQQRRAVPTSIPQQRALPTDIPRRRPAVPEQRDRRSA